MPLPPAESVRGGGSRGRASREELGEGGEQKVEEEAGRRLEEVGGGERTSRGGGVLDRSLELTISGQLWMINLHAVPSWVVGGRCRSGVGGFRNE